MLILHEKKRVQRVYIHEILNAAVLGCLFYTSFPYGFLTRSIAATIGIFSQDTWYLTLRISFLSLFFLSLSSVVLSLLSRRSKKYRQLVLSLSASFFVFIAFVLFLTWDYRQTHFMAYLVIGIHNIFTSARLQSYE